MHMLSRSVRTVACMLAALACAACSDSETSEAADATSSAPVSASNVPVALLSGETSPATPAIPVPAPPQVPARSYYVIDYTTGAVIAASNENQRVEPASITKLMVAYAVFHALQDGRITLDDLVTISPHARAQEGSRMFVEVGSKVRVEDLIQGMIVQSGNDATVALAEHVAGSEPVFVDLMNQYAQKLGLVDTHFENSPGMPAPQHYTTARDIAVLAAALVREFPQYFKWYSQREFTWNKITQPNRNGLLDRDPSVDGLKTGHTESAGYCLVATGKRDGMRIISVVMGAPSVRAREDASLALLNYGFRFFETKQLLEANKPVLTARVWKGQVNEIALAPREDIYVTVPRGQEAALAGAADIANPLLAPLDRDTAAGKLRITRGENLVGTYDLYPVADVSAAGIFGRLWDDVLLMFE
jgi:D-alanyl-D-alanine carboxypeptidase (penicillin-binding protein 5/6)